MYIKEGELAPDFTLPVADGATVSLSGFRGRNVVLYFYPKDNTPGCTLEAKDFRDLMDEFARYDTEVIGISKDSVKSHIQFANKCTLPFLLASDSESDVCERYGVYQEKSFMGKKYNGIVRTTFLIDRTGLVQKVWPNVSITGHAQDVLNAARNL
ncbi:thioredoxin-dependent thiol peroxidase [Rickettsiales endosymbiont of Peranema trichophorum]|uniref:thioredoxin-dependent thiol peroxidase n=1 Tax=Rickettsiales endosymbiont of Peranema trichophorum TaxID=2486577 RepID=UPI0010232300|nr:thioredoxin-dependent thiol peroxidase [Rickettsiales endosymbiont of Peranema trichophorum]RZI47783.1 thioredoxin-dependent thiol peroxidase [Rickettsiales endosymbiont of Peranema trichophorum]